MLTARRSGRGYKTNTFVGPQRAEVIKQPNELKSWYFKEKDTELFRVLLSEQKRVDSQREKKRGSLKDSIFISKWRNHFLKLHWSLDNCSLTKYNNNS